MKLYTTGYGGLEPARFLSLLASRGIRAVADVRLRPDRASMGAYTMAKSPEKGLQALLNQAGIPYSWFPELGNIFLGLPDWKSRYAKLLEQSGELLTERLKTLTVPFGLLCAEKLPDECHRRPIAEYLVGLGHEVEHLGAIPETRCDAELPKIKRTPWTAVDSTRSLQTFKGRCLYVG